jgi:hypothetical protein
MTEQRGSCHCGQIRLALSDEPIEGSECNCSVCRRTAGLCTLPARNGLHLGGGSRLPAG